MKEIALPQTHDDEIDIIQRYFYGSSPSFQIRQGDGRKDYIPYYYHRAGYRKENEPEAIRIIRSHVEGNDTWATRAVQGHQAYFAAMDVDTTDTRLLEPLRMRLYETYGWTYNWEQSESGVHVWFLWEDTIPLDIATDFIELLELPPHIEKVAHIRYPTKRQLLRLPFPGNYSPTPSFPERNQLVVLTVEDIESIIGDNERKSRGNHSNVLSTTVQSIPPVYSGHMLKNTQTTKPTYTDRDQSDLNSLKSRVNEFLDSIPEDGQVYQQLINENMLANTVAVYGEGEGIVRLESWIRSGDPDRVTQRIEELHKYHQSNVSKGWSTLYGPLCTPNHMAQYESGMFDDLLIFIDDLKHLSKERKSKLRQNVDQVLFIMLVSTIVVREHNKAAKKQSHHLIPYMSTRQLAEVMGMGERERRQAGTARSYLTYNDHHSKDQSLKVFEVVEHATEFKSPRFVLNPTFNYLLERVERALNGKPCRQTEPATETSPNMEPEGVTA